MSRSVQVPISGVGFCPYHQIHRDQPERGCGRVRLRQAAPIHKAAEQPALHQMGENRLHPGPMEGLGLWIGDGRGGHREPSLPTHHPMFGDRGIEGQVGEDQPRHIGLHQSLHHVRIMAIAANQPMRTELEPITDPRDGNARKLQAQHRQCSIFLRRDRPR